MKWSRRPGKGDWERKVRPTRFTHLSPLPCEGRWVSFGIGRSVWTLHKAPLLGAAFSHYKAPQNHRARLISSSGRVMHSHRHTTELESKAESVCTEKAERVELWVFLPCPEDPGQAPKMIAYSNRCQICDLRRRFSFGTRDQAWSLKSIYVAEFIKVKKDRESFWHRHQKGNGVCPTQ